MARFKALASAPATSRPSLAPRPGRPPRCTRALLRADGAKLGVLEPAQEIWQPAIDVDVEGRELHSRGRTRPACQRRQDKLASSTATMPVRKMPSKVPAPPIEATGAPMPWIL